MGWTTTNEQRLEWLGFLKTYAEWIGGPGSAPTHAMLYGENGFGGCPPSPREVRKCLREMNRQRPVLFVAILTVSWEHAGVLLHLQMPNGRCMTKVARFRSLSPFKLGEWERLRKKDKAMPAFRDMVAFCRKFKSTTWRQSPNVLTSSTSNSVLALVRSSARAQRSNSST
jgi:hypothetical protein